MGLVLHQSKQGLHPAESYLSQIAPPSSLSRIGPIVRRRRLMAEDHGGAPELLFAPEVPGADPPASVGHHQEREVPAEATGRSALPRDPFLG